MQRIAAVALVAGWMVAPAAAAAPIDLDAPGAMDALANRNPGHHARIVRLIAVAQHADCWSRELERSKVQLDVRDVDCTLLLKTSDPPKRILSFALDGTVYRTLVVLNVDPPTLQRVR